MKANQFIKEQKAQVGIGTMIVFIATILVATVAAGVLISVGGDLQSQSQATGKQASNDVANALIPVRVYAIDRVNAPSNAGAGPPATSQDTEDVGADDDEMDELQVLVNLAPGSADVDLANAKVIVDDGSSVRTFVYTTLTDADDGVGTESDGGEPAAAPAASGADTLFAGNFFTLIKQGDESSTETRLGQNDLYAIRIVGSYSNEDVIDGGADTEGNWGDGLGIAPGDSVKITVQIPNGASMFLELKMPNVMDDNIEQLY